MQKEKNRTFRLAPPGLTPMVLAFALALLVAGCGTKEGHRLLSLEEMTSEGGSRLAEKANCSGSGCSDVTVMTTYGSFMTAEKELEKADRDCSASTQPCTKLISKYINAGITHSDRLCDDLFTKKFRMHQTANFVQDSLNAAGAAAGTAMALTGAPLTAMGLTAAGVGFGNLEIQFYKQALLIDKSVDIIYKNLKKGREGSAAILKRNANNSAYPDYASARGALFQYHEMCSIPSIAYFIAESLGQTKLVPEAQEEGNGRIAELTTQVNLILSGNKGAYTSQQLQAFASNKEANTAPILAIKALYDDRKSSKAYIDGLLSELSNLLDAQTAAQAPAAPAPAPKAPAAQASDPKAPVIQTPAVQAPTPQGQQRGRNESSGSEENQRVQPGGNALAPKMPLSPLLKAVPAFK